jgi:hypothetical protein
MNIPTLEQRLSSITEARKAAQEAQRKAQETWVKDRPRFKPFALGDQVWLEGTNLKLPVNLTSKLSLRQYGLFTVAAIISPVTYQLELPLQWKIHNVFHTSLLTPYKETEQHGRNFIEPPPDIIEGEPKWEVKQILGTQHFGRTRKLQFHICWKGYSPSHDSWENATDVHTMQLVEDFYNKNPVALRAIKELLPSQKKPSPLTCPSLHSPQPAAISPAQSPSLTTSDILMHVSRLAIA